MNPLEANGWPLRTWLAYYRLLGAYHRFEVHGFEHLRQGGAALLAGYHGKPVTYDLAMLSVRMFDELGYFPHGVFHGAFALPGLRAWLDGLGCVSGDDPRLADVVARGEHLIVAPGGTREAHRSSLHRYRVDWGHRVGYLRLAARLRIPVIPVGAAGVDDAYVGLLDGYRVARRLRLPPLVPLWLGWGPLGPWPLTPPFPVKITQVIGAPIPDTAEGRVDPDDREALLALHQRVIAAVQESIDRARARAPHPQETP